MSFQRLNNNVLSVNIMNYVLFNSVLTLFKWPVKIYKLCHRKHASREVLLIKKNVIYKESLVYKEKTGTVTKVKLFTKIKKYNQLYYETLVLLMWR